MWIANFFVGGSLTMVLPFISLYIEEFGNFSDAYVQNWSGWIFGISFGTAFIFSNIWGLVVDKFGRKNILILFAVGMEITVTFIGFVKSIVTHIYHSMIYGHLFFAITIPMVIIYI